MSEQRRMEYLDALGIEQFVPRKHLIGAKASVALVRNETLAVVEQPQAAIINSSNATEEQLPLQPVISQPVAKLVEQVTHRLISGEATAVTTQPRQPVHTSGMVPTQRVLRFALTVWHLPGWLWIDSRQSQQALPTDALLHNILSALNIKEPVKAEVITWPPVESPLQTQDWAEAREMLQSFLTPRIQSGERLILMGEAAYNACTQGPFDFAERLAESLPLAHPSNVCLLLPSLAQMLTQPALKARVWQQLRQV
ncbi:MAG TPA: hypothetical protein VIZ65_13485 [Cellvibrionaceae bacterium]